MKPRVRFAPNPSGELHVGSARAALFNWLFARHTGGTFIVRIEDTDPETAKPEFVQPILDALRWLGLDWDEGPEVGGAHGPYFQSQRRAIHQKTLDQLVASNKVYRCYCTPEEVKSRGTARGYDRYCRELTAQQLEDFAGRAHALRIRVPDHDIVFKDVIRGEISVSASEVQDYVVARSDGTPTFVLANVSDDLAMEITHAVRGEDLISAATQTSVLYDALGEKPPLYAHLPLVLDEQRHKLSKRKMPTGIQIFRQEGYLSEALTNFLALLGWSSPTLDEILSKDRMVEEFTLDRVQNHGAVFDRKKLDWMNAEYVKAMEPSDLVNRVCELYKDVDPPTLEQAVALDLIATRVTRLDQIPESIAYLSARVEPSPEDRTKFLDGDSNQQALKETSTKLEALTQWTVEAIDRAIRDAVEVCGLNMRKGTAPTRVAIAGSPVSLPLFESMFILGKDETLARLANYR